jgi:hypothetical protein
MPPCLSKNTRSAPPLSQSSSAVPAVCSAAPPSVSSKSSQPRPTPRPIIRPAATSASPSRSGGHAMIPLPARVEPKGRVLPPSIWLSPTSINIPPYPAPVSSKPQSKGTKRQAQQDKNRFNRRQKLRRKAARPIMDINKHLQAYFPDPADAPTPKGSRRSACNSKK